METVQEHAPVLLLREDSDSDETPDETPDEDSSVGNELPLDDSSGWLPLLSLGVLPLLLLADPK
jgi:hypothetical protein